MIPAIGLMIAAYIFTRMLQIIVRSNPKEHGAVVTFAALTIGITALSSFTLLLGGIDPAARLVPTPSRTEPIIDASVPRPTPPPRRQPAGEVAAAPHLNATHLLKMSMLEVTTAIGQPNSINNGLWIYHTKQGRLFSVHFNADGEVDQTEPANLDLAELQR